MNNTKSLILLCVMLLSSVAIFAQKASKIQEAEIKTSAICGMCEETITEALTFHKGVLAVSMDMETKVVKVRFNSKKTNIDGIRAKIASAGYDADDVVANAEAYEKLHGCCKKGGSCAPKEEVKTEEGGK